MKLKKKNIVIFLVIFLMIIGLGYYAINNFDFKSENIKPKEVKINYHDYYFNQVKALNDKVLYTYEDSKMQEIGMISTDNIISLEEDDLLETGYFKIKDSDYYIDYKDLEENNEEIIEDLFWKNYIPYNLSIRTNEKTNFYDINDKLIFELNSSLELPIVIKEDNKYGVIYKDKLFYIKNDECETFENHNTDLGYTKGIAALVYHFVYDSENPDEKKECLNANSTICLSDLQFEKHLNYIQENGFYTATMKDVEMFVDGKVQLPAKTVVITIDDGYFVKAAIKMLEKHNLHGTLFLIGTAGNPEDYKSDNLEIHSHTYDLHIGGCSGGQGSALKCFPKEQILEDLRKSRESLNNTTYFCWPFFEYNDYAIGVLKEAGFTMAFVGGRKKITVGYDKMKLPRYGVVNDTYVSDIARIIN